MIVPEFWAEARRKDRIEGRQVTIRRFGWSDTNLEEAQQNADARLEDAFARVIAGEKLERRERKISYNGSEGVPIREEIIERHQDSVVTRNSYGARCLNTPDVMFVDIDFSEGPGIGLSVALTVILMLCGVAFGWATGSIGKGFLAAFAGLILGQILTQYVHKWRVALSGGVEKQARTRFENFIAAHPDWHLRLYRTPAGFRILVMHRTFDPREEAVKECFQALGTDPVYMRMCFNQNCFRARVSPKPWRIGIDKHMRPRPGVWPIKPEHMPNRLEWIKTYEAAATDFASCRFVETAGSTAVDPKAAFIQQVHDEMCRADSELTIA